ncbi:unnamed protein product [Calypogeia fissa]
MGEMALSSVPFWKRIKLERCQCLNRMPDTETMLLRAEMENRTCSSFNDAAIVPENDLVRRLCFFVVVIALLMIIRLFMDLFCALFLPSFVLRTVVDVSEVMVGLEISGGELGTAVASEGSSRGRGTY